MMTEEQVREAYEKFLKDNPKEWIYTEAGDLTKAWYDGYREAMELILGENDE